MSPETAYLVTLVRAWAGGAKERLPSPPGLDGARFLGLLEAHQVECALTPLMDEALLTPAAAHQAAESCRRTSLLLLELERVLATITTSDCTPVVLKGAGLALAWYGRPQDRWFVDLDLLVPRDQVIRSCELLLELGYRHFGGGVNLAYYDKYHLHRILVSPHGVIVEIHWDLTVPQSVYDFDVPGVFARARTVRLGRRRIQVACAVDQVLQGVYQHIADGFLDLRRFMDLALLLPGLGEDDWLYLVKESRRNRMAVALGTVLRMFRAILDRPVPEWVITQLSPGPVIGRILRGLDLPEVCLGREADNHRNYNNMLHLLVVPDTKIRLRELGHLAWPKRVLVYDGVHYPQPLPSFLHRLRLGFYYLRGLSRLAGKVIRAYAAG